MKRSFRKKKGKVHGRDRKKIRLVETDYRFDGCSSNVFGINKIRNFFCDFVLSEMVFEGWRPQSRVGVRAVSVKPPFAAPLLLEFALGVYTQIPRLDRAVNTYITLTLTQTPTRTLKHKRLQEHTYTNTCTDTYTQNTHTTDKRKRRHSLFTLYTLHCTLYKRVKEKESERVRE